MSNVVETSLEFKCISTTTDQIRMRIGAKSCHTTKYVSKVSPFFREVSTIPEKPVKGWGGEGGGRTERSSTSKHTCVLLLCGPWTRPADG